MYWVRLSSENKKVVSEWLGPFESTFLLFEGLYGCESQADPIVQYLATVGAWYYNDQAFARIDIGFFENDPNVEVSKDKSTEPAADQTSRLSMSED